MNKMAEETPIQRTEEARDISDFVRTSEFANLTNDSTTDRVIFDMARRKNRLRPIKKTYLITWKGTKIPNNIDLDGIRIEWMQHGVVYGNHTMFGYYDRIVEFGGQSRDEHICLAYIPGK
jgi:hypothetical protein